MVGEIRNTPSVPEFPLGSKVGAPGEAPLLRSLAIEF
jgi:hypothetical protein